MARAILRDRTRTTQVLILGELAEGATLSSCAIALEITVQAVSAHARTMQRQGLLALEGTAYKPTAKGIQQLHEGVRLLREALGDLTASLSVIHVTSAVAQTAVRTGDALSLLMNDGDLAARPGSGPSTGRARNDARPGDEVIVGELRGVVRLDPGTLHLVSVPGPAEGGVRRVDEKKLVKRLNAIPISRVAAQGTGARILARRLEAAGVRPCDFDYAAADAAFNAAERGLDVLLFATRDRLPEALQTVERLNQRTLRQVRVEAWDAPVTDG